MKRSIISETRNENWMKIKLCAFCAEMSQSSR